MRPGKLGEGRLEDGELRGELVDVGFLKVLPVRGELLRRLRVPRKGSEPNAFAHGWRDSELRIARGNVEVVFT